MPDYKRLKNSSDGYYTICVNDLMLEEDIEVVPYPLYYASFLTRIIFAMHHSERINKVIRLPFKSIWFSRYFKNEFKNNRPLCFVILNYHLSNDYLNYLKTTYKGCKIVCVHRDLIKIYEKKYQYFPLNKVYDLELSFDENECLKYGFIHFDEFESRISVPRAPNYPLSDLFFAGKAKDRLNLLINIYDLMTKNGVNCEFLITGVAKKNQIFRKGVHYLKKGISYKEFLFKSVNSNCLLDINQKGSVGFTSRFLEAVMYNKKLITNNSTIKKSKFYNAKYIQCFEDASLIDCSFVKKDIGEIRYNYSDEFSPIALINMIDNMLTK